MALFVCFTCESPCILFVVEEKGDDFKIPDLCPWGLDEFKWRKFKEVDE